ncbi:MAG: hypothetical protein ACK561_17910 [Pseudomonadaceae bacterium]
MRELTQAAYQHGSTLTQAGIALETIGNLLGCDGGEHYLNRDDRNGLHHTVAVIGALLKDAGYKLCAQAEEAEEALEEQANAQEAQQ